MADGIVSNIQKFSLHDGPGIRSTVFLKGCPLRCEWCHNPESQSAEPELVFVENRCIRCGTCLSVCPEASEQKAENPSFEFPSYCQRCGMCIDQCPTTARQIIGQRMSAEEVMDAIARDRIFYDQSGGGVTFSGGEPLQQIDFLIELLIRCQQHGLHTAVDTCGFGPEEDVRRIADLCDLVLFDVKMMDAEKHRKWTGVSNDCILKNLTSLGMHHHNIWIRIPMIPGVNDDPQELESMAAFFVRLPGIRQINLLPYHSMSGQKHHRLGRKYRLAHLDPPSRVDMEPLTKPFIARGFHTVIG
jgi:pyruvate formate lyase activating enzyme